MNLSLSSDQELLRVDYRILKLKGEPNYGTVHRVYSGVHLAF